MAVISKNTQQTPITTGKTGTQSVKLIDAARVYIKSADTVSTPIVVKSGGTTPAGYTDLGVVNGKVKITYDKEVRDVTTGIDEVLRASYIKKKTANFEFVLSQLDDVVMEQLTGLTASQIVSGSVYQFPLGKEDIVTRALLLVVQNKLDGKEHQFYNPTADISFTIEDSGDETVVRGKGSLKAFTHASDEILIMHSIFA